MSLINEALKKAQRQRGDAPPGPPPISGDAMPPPGPPPLPRAPKPARNLTLLGADRQHAQSGRSQQAHCRDAFKQDNIIFDRHGKPVAPLRIVV